MSIIKKNCDNGTCNGGRAWTTDESCERDSSKMFCCGECADEWVSLGKKGYVVKENYNGEEPTDELTSADKISLMSLFVKKHCAGQQVDEESEVSPTRWETFIVKGKDFNVVTECKFCGWMSEFPQSHLTHAMQSGCQYIEARYDLAAEMEKQFN